MGPDSSECAVETSLVLSCLTLFFLCVFDLIVWFISMASVTSNPSNAGPSCGLKTVGKSASGCDSDHSLRVPCIEDIYENVLRFVSGRLV